MSWPTHRTELERLQIELSGLRPEPWEPASPLRIGGCFVCFERGGPGPGGSGDHGWAAAVVMEGRRLVAVVEAEGRAAAPYEPGLLAAREGPLLASAVGELSGRADGFLVNATGRDHPRRAGLALHLGWVLDLPTVGVTHRPLVADGDPPGPWTGSRAPLRIAGEQVGWWLRARPGVRPLAVSPGWRTDLDTCVEVVTAAVRRVRTPEPIRQARRLARTARGKM